MIMKLWQGKSSRKDHFGPQLQVKESTMHKTKRRAPMTPFLKTKWAVVSATPRPKVLCAVFPGGGWLSTLGECFQSTRDWGFSPWLFNCVVTWWWHHQWFVRREMRQNVQYGDSMGQRGFLRVLSASFLTSSFFSQRTAHQGSKIFCRSIVVVWGEGMHGAKEQAFRMTMKLDKVGG